MATTVSGVVVFVASLHVGGLAVHLGSTFVLKERSSEHAVVTRRPRRVWAPGA